MRIKLESLIPQEKAILYTACANLYLSYHGQDKITAKEAEKILLKDPLPLQINLFLAGAKLSMLSFPTTGCLALKDFFRPLETGRQELIAEVTRLDSDLGTKLSQLTDKKTASAEETLVQGMRAMFASTVEIKVTPYATQRAEVAKVMIMSEGTDENGVVQHSVKCKMEGGEHRVMVVGNKITTKTPNYSGMPEVPCIMPKIPFSLKNMREWVENVSKVPLAVIQYAVDQVCTQEWWPIEQHQLHTVGVYYSEDGVPFSELIKLSPLDYLNNELIR